MEADWAGLPRDLLVSIRQRLPVVDYVRFGGVCTMWRSAHEGRRVIPNPPPPQAPWLLGSSSVGEGEVVFLDVVHGMMRRMTVPNLRGMWWAASGGRGWVAAVDEASEVRLVNPLTGAPPVVLPSVTTTPLLKPSADGVGEYLHRFKTCEEFRAKPMSKIRKFFVRKVVLSSGAAPDVMIIFNYLNNVAFARAGAGEWSWTQDCHMADAVFHEGLFHSVDLHNRVFTWDVSGPAPRRTEVENQPPDDYLGYVKVRRYLVHSSGHLLLVTRGMDDVPDDDSRYTTGKVSVYRLDGEDWVPVRSLGDRTLFLGNGDSLSISAGDVPGLRRNCIYFTDNCWDFFYYYDAVDWERDMGVFDMQDGSFRALCPTDCGIKSWPPPIWFMPSVLGTTLYHFLFLFYVS